MANLRIKIVLTLADHDGPEKGSIATYISVILRFAKVGLMHIYTMSRET